MTLLGFITFCLFYFFIKVGMHEPYIFMYICYAAKHIRNTNKILIDNYLGCPIFDI